MNTIGHKVFRGSLHCTFLLALCATVCAVQHLPVKGCSESWVWLNPIPGGSFHGSIQQTRVGILVFDLDGSGALLSRDTGRTWEHVQLRDTFGTPINDLSGNGYNRVYTIHAVNDTTLFYVNSTGLIRESTDGGLHWFLNGGAISSPTEAQFKMVTNTFGWITSVAGSSQTAASFALTRDGGKKWTAVLTDTNSGGTGFSAFFLDANTGWVEKAFSLGTGQWQATLFRTSDGGDTWRESGLSPSAVFPEVFVFQDSLHGIGLHGYGSLYRTSDGGLTWMALAGQLTSTTDSNNGGAFALFSDGNIAQLAFHIPIMSGDTSVRERIVCGNTTNFGEEWRRDTTYPLNHDAAAAPISCVFLSPRCVGIVGASGLLLISSNSGMSWSRNDAFDACRIQDMVFLNRDTGFVFTGGTVAPVTGGVYRTVDAGNTWSRIVTIPSDVGYFHALASDSILYVGTASSRLFRSDDAGDSFEEIMSLPAHTLPFAALEFVGARGGWLFSVDEGMWKTTDACLTWTQQRPEGGVDPNGAGRFSSASMIDDEWGWCIEEKFLRTTNGGVVWEFVTLPDSISGYSRIVFVNRSHGYLVGLNLMETIDSGASWHPVDTVYGNAMHFRDTSFGWVGNFVTTDGGKHWSNHECNSIYPSSTWWIDTSVGWSGDVNVANALFRYGDAGDGASSVREHAIWMSSKRINSFPNPISGAAVIDLSEISQAEVDNAASSLRLIDALGREVANVTSLLRGHRTVSIDAGGMAPGVYYCQGIFGNTLFSRALMVVH